MSEDQQYEQAVKSLKEWRKAHWQRVLSAPVIAAVKPRPKSEKGPQPFDNHIPVRREVPYVEGGRRR